MQFSPRFNQAFLPPRQGTGNYFDRIDAKDPYFLLIISVKMWDMMLCAHLCEHSNDDAEEST